MKKIIAALDGLHFSPSTMDYTLYMAKHTHAHIVGVFLDDVSYHSYKFSELITEEGGISDRRMHDLNEEDKERRVVSVQLFENACRQAGISYSVHRDRNLAIHELLHESIYADLLVIDSKETFTRIEEVPPTRFMRDLLTDVQCPVLIAPKSFVPVQKVLLLYDGEPASVYAVKIFSYVLASFKHLPIEVLSVKNPGQTLHVPDNRLMKEFMKRHYPAAEYVVLKGSADDSIVTYLKQRSEDILIVLGAYRRGRVSRWFKASMADILMTHIKAPLFIAHNR